jgi:hypothetical protein
MLLTLLVTEDNQLTMPLKREVQRGAFHHCSTGPETCYQKL